MAVTESKATARYLAGLQRKYGIAPDEYRALYYAQGGRCYVCRRATGRTRRLGVDHDHLTGEVRALVCTGSISAMTCNRLIAIYRREQLLRAVAVLSDPPPARAVLVGIRTGRTWLPSLVGGPPFEVSRVDDMDLSAQRPAQGTGRVFVCTCGGPLGAMMDLGDSCLIHPEG